MKITSTPIHTTMNPQNGDTTELTATYVPPLMGKALPIWAEATQMNSATTAASR